jgi:hypothetical protein
MTYFANVYQIPNDGRRWLGHAFGSEHLVKTLGRPNVVYRLRITPKPGFTIADVVGAK